MSSPEEIPTPEKEHDAMWANYIAEEIKVAQKMAGQGTFAVNTITVRVENEGEFLGPPLKNESILESVVEDEWKSKSRPKDEWNPESTTEAVREITEMWLEEYPTPDTRITAAIKMIEDKDHPWYGMGKYFQQVPLGRPVVNRNIERHNEELDSTLVERFRLPEEDRDTSLHFSFLDHGENGLPYRKAPVTAFFTSKEAAIPLIDEESEAVIYKQLRFIVLPRLLARLNPGLKNAVQPLALESKRNLFPLLQEELAEALMDEKTDIAPIMSHRFLRIESVEGARDTTEKEEIFDDSALRLSQPPSSLGLGERQSPSSSAA